MSSGTVTLPGGDTAAVFVNSTETNLIQQALNAIPFTPDNILTSTTVSPTGGDYNWYSIKTSHASITLPSGGQALALQAGAGDTVTGNSDAGQLIVGGSGQDTFNAVGGSGSIFTGDGQNVVNV